MMPLTQSNSSSHQEHHHTLNNSTHYPHHPHVSHRHSARRSMLILLFLVPTFLYVSHTMFIRAATSVRESCDAELEAVHTAFGDKIARMVGEMRLQVEKESTALKHLAVASTETRQAEMARDAASRELRETKAEGERIKAQLEALQAALKAAEEERDLLKLQQVISPSSPASKPAVDAVSSKLTLLPDPTSLPVPLSGGIEVRPLTHLQMKREEDRKKEDEKEREKKDDVAELLSLDVQESKLAAELNGENRSAAAPAKSDGAPTDPSAAKDASSNSKTSQEAELEALQAIAKVLTTPTPPPPPVQTEQVAVKEATPKDATPGAAAPSPNPGSSDPTKASDPNPSTPDLSSPLLVSSATASPSPLSSLSSSPPSLGAAQASDPILREAEKNIERLERAEKVLEAGGGHTVQQGGAAAGAAVGEEKLETTTSEATETTNDAADAPLPVTLPSSATDIKRKLIRRRPKKRDELANEAAPATTPAVPATTESSPVAPAEQKQPDVHADGAS